MWLSDCFEPAMNTLRVDADVVNFGELDPKTNELLQQGVVAYRTDREKADSLFKQALALTPQELAPYYCLYKIHTYMGSLDYAADVAAQGMKEATRQAGWPSDPTAWPAQAEAHDGPARFALYTLKALSFIELKRGHSETAKEYLDILSRADPQGSVGWKVIEELAQGSV
jgi:tetratricopeptide (TPR) repeat protein